MQIKLIQENIKEILWLICLSILCAFICHLIYTRIGGDLMKLFPGWHQESMTGKIAAPLQYRILSFYIPDYYAKWMQIDIASAYLAIRMASLGLSFYFSGLIVRKLTNESLAPSLIILALAIYYAASIQAHIQPAEEPNLFFFSVITWLVVRGAGIIPIVCIFILGALNKDTVGFLIPFIFLQRWVCQKSLTTALKDGAILSVIFIGIYIGLRIYYGIDREYLGGVWQAGKNFNFILRMPARALMWTLPSILPMIFLLCNWKSVPTIVKCYIPTAMLFVLGHFMISITDEFRTYSPLALMMWTGVLLSLIHI